ncbi:family 43 glycosylhydrolase [Bacteroides xylanisolvens]|uniref:Family 43 glycosylhydrolase n=1 Tax=Bacteroides xylanisolvens TaxID=371601 RepID=A0AAW4SXH3_9BACE|nr:family 43 glycosylhydrolase [Bacteroides xylanisolvens]MCA4532154.1 family 43 glycosylhydrolase [Bacteroides xylanisolvens]MCA4550031.1 family 43 glycosylhydrolase [Bacteroides xylanisolvens]MCA4563515.1 family 43 glycosylhydrolase [Bacteroides xylanisolvens]MCA4568415.1 family 43 glycosylhydrolase [Bacteroides xylanisolvens]MCA4599157.1 family 43 glycosylhydrolase [Bacteroides xylanisolvens]
MKKIHVLLLFCFLLVIVSCQTKESSLKETRKVFPHKMPAEKPDFPLSAAMERMFDYPAPRVQDNELYTTFKYTALEGFDYNGGDGTITRRDPSRPILVGGKYYMWYTKRDTKHLPVGAARADEATDEIPSTDWDLCDIWYATSTDGFKWEEQGVAVPRPPKPNLGWRSVATPDILVWKGKYYLYFQAFNEPSGLKGDWCPISMAYADSPEGPWTHTGKMIFPFGEKGDWDQDQAQDPHPIVYKGKIYLYYKAAYNKWPDVRDRYAVAHGLAIAKDPFGPFEKHPLSPVMNTGHETTYFPYKNGVAALAIRDGNERETIQYAEDGVNFHVASVVSLAPTAAGTFTPDAFTDTNDGRGITWGVCHFTNAGEEGKRHSIIARFDCDLSRDCNDKVFKQTTIYHTPDVYFRQGLGGLKKKRMAESEIKK